MAQIKYCCLVIIAILWLFDIMECSSQKELKSDLVDEEESSIEVTNIVEKILEDWNIENDISEILDDLEHTLNVDNRQFKTDDGYPYPLYRADNLPQTDDRINGFKLDEYNNGKNK